jgi:hypothetical protein
LIFVAATLPKPAARSVIWIGCMSLPFNFVSPRIGTAVKGPASFCCSCANAVQADAGNNAPPATDVIPLRMSRRFISFGFSFDSSPITFTSQFESTSSSYSAFHNFLSVYDGTLLALAITHSAEPSHHNRHCLGLAMVPRGCDSDSVAAYRV